MTKLVEMGDEVGKMVAKLERWVAKLMEMSR
jgi:hypothetical protein